MKEGKKRPDEEQVEKRRPSLVTDRVLYQGGGGEASAQVLDGLQSMPNLARSLDCRRMAQCRRVVSCDEKVEDVMHKDKGWRAVGRRDMMEKKGRIGQQGKLTGTKKAGRQPR